MGTVYVTSPIYLPDGTKAAPNRKYALNLNIYRNTCPHKLNNMKVKYKTLMAEHLESLPVMGRVHITYKLFVASARKSDISNVCCVVDKFFCDALVSYGVIGDDNYDYLPVIHYEFGGIDRKNPRVEIIITES